MEKTEVEIIHRKGNEVWNGKEVKQCVVERWKQGVEEDAVTKRVGARRS